jgi:ATP-binding cassette subfamily B protein
VIHKSFRSFARLFSYMPAYRSDFIWGTIFSFLKKVLDVAPEIIIGVVIDVVVNRQNSFLARWGMNDPLDQLILLSSLTLVIWVLESLSEFALLLKWRGLAQALQHDFRMDAYAHLQKLDMAYFEDRSTGTLVSILNDDINQLERFFNEGMNNFVQICTSTLLIGAVFFYLSPAVALFAFLPMPLIFMGAFYFQTRAAPLYAKVRDAAGKVSSRLSNNIAGMSTIRSFGRGSHEVERLRRESHDYYGANKEAIAVAARFNPLIRMGVLMGFLATFIVGGTLALKGSLNVASYGVLVFLSQRLLWPLRDLAGTVDLFERAMASADRVIDLLETPPRLEVATGSRDFSESIGIEFKDLSFSYANGVEVLSNVNLKIEAGKTVAIVGSTGSGKSTITKLLLRFYEPTHGEIFFDGRSMNKLEPHALREQIGLVSQDVFLFDGNIRENIAYGKQGASLAEVKEAARRAFADSFIERLPGAYDTLIGERGQKLSGGQRQRLSIARVILKNPPVLIFDEATSAVDNETEALIQRSLMELAKNRTTILIAHRLSTVVHADLIYVLSGGKVAEIGTHHELLAQKSIYSQLWKLQTREKEVLG